MSLVILFIVDYLLAMVNVWLGLDHCFIDLARNSLVSLECRTCQYISHIMGSNVELAKQVFSRLWSKTIHHTC
jgi:hypothetical protein